MKVTKIIHGIWKEWDSMPKEIKNQLHFKDPIIGKYQYVYENKKARISLIKLNYNLNFFLNKTQNYCWEICGGGLTDDCERFRTKVDAEKRIEELLEENIP